eukprot:jgi/Hompol1/1374/HPOL_003608-RA
MDKMEEEEQEQDEAQHLPQTGSQSLHSPSAGKDDLSSVESFEDDTDLQTDTAPASQPHIAEPSGTKTPTAVATESTSQMIQTLSAEPSPETLSVAEKIQRAFELPQVETYRGEFPCWLVRSVLLRGWMYLTDKHMCFFAMLHRSDLYYPISTISLKSITEITMRTPTSFTLTTPQKTHSFTTDTPQSTQSWLHALRAASFRSRNLGDDVRVVFPLSAISEIDVTAMGGIEDTLRVKVVDAEFFIVEEYFFKAVGDVSGVVEMIKRLMGNARSDDRRDNESGHCSVGGTAIDDAADATAVQGHAVSRRSGDIERSSSMRNRVSLYDTTTLTSLPSAPLIGDGSRTITGDQPSSQLPRSGQQQQRTEQEPFSSRSKPSLVRTSAETTPKSTRLQTHHRRAHSELDVSQQQQQQQNVEGHVPQPPPPPKPESLLQLLKNSLPNITMTGDVRAHEHSEPTQQRHSIHSIAHTPSPAPLASQQPVSKLPLQTQQTSSTSLLSMKRDSAVDRRSWWGHRKTSSDGGNLLGASLSQQKIDAFRASFPVSESDILHHTVSCYLDRVIPRYGTLYISDHFVCFKSKLVGIRGKVMVPLREVIQVDAIRRYTSLYYALVLTMQTQEEIKFDFHTSDARSKAHQILTSLLRPYLQKPSTLSQSSQNLPTAPTTMHIETPYIPSILDPAHLALPAQSLHITCLTIGTRGDVQPYIALCKSLMQDGHTCRIATHSEYANWITAFGIEFHPLKGNPAELMQLCVTHGLFTVSFLREAVSKFRGWVDELLVSCWEAVQNTDLIIESPTAMGGLHCAERLDIPYFAAFPMPWTKTRVYPHPFAVPEYHLGGNYNLMTHVLIEQIFFKGVAAQVNRFRKQSLDL